MLCATQTGTHGSSPAQPSDNDVPFSGLSFVSCLVGFSHGSVGTPRLSGTLHHSLNIYTVCFFNSFESLSARSALSLVPQQFSQCCAQQLPGQPELLTGKQAQVLLLGQSLF